MVRAENYERLLVESITSDRGLAAAVNDLLGHLLSELSEYQRRSTDGVSLEYSAVAGGRAVASGVVVMIEDQTAEPLRAEFTLDTRSARLSTALVCFGDKTRNAVYGSAEDRKLRHAIIANPNVEFSWKECFHRDVHGWHHGTA
jgi:hypothetical protein